MLGISRVSWLSRPSVPLGKVAVNKLPAVVMLDGTVGPLSICMQQRQETFLELAKYLC